MPRVSLPEVFARKVEAPKPPAGRKIRILPQQPSKRRAIEGPHTVEKELSTQPDGFFEAFGPTGMLLLLAASASVCWTAWLIVLTISPNETANYLMDTAEFDDGHFWLIIDPDPALMSVNAIALVALAVSYVHVLLKMTVLRNSSFRVVPVGPRKEEVTPFWASKLPYVGRYLRSAGAFWIELTGYYGMYRKFWVRGTTFVACLHC
jgi:hypothetical protein